MSTNSKDLFKGKCKLIKSGDAFTVGPYQWSHNKLSFDSKVLQRFNKFFETKIKTEDQLCLMCDVKTLNYSRIDMEMATNNDDNTSIILRFGIQALDPKEILEAAQERNNFVSKRNFISMLSKQIQRVERSSNFDMQADNLLDFSDFEPNEDEIRKERVDTKRLLDIIDVISCSSLYPNIMFEITPLSKLKIAATNLSQLLINKPINGDKKLENMCSGYLCLDQNGRLTPVSSVSCQNNKVVGVWVFGSDFSSYHVQNNQNTVRASEISVKTNKEEYMSNLLKSPFVWASLVKFLIDESVYCRSSCAETQDTFILVSFTRVSIPQFYQFKMTSNTERVRSSTNTDRQGSNNLLQSEHCTVLSLNNNTPEAEEPIKSKYTEIISI